MVPWAWTSSRTDVSRSWLDPVLSVSCWCPSMAWMLQPECSVVRRGTCQTLYGTGECSNG
ncbi:hypothetical protein IF2G_07820 [Cordyceps javanica]|nr:hypothetical protein IF2G_07820 [Cordyceps javanica]